MGHIDENSMVDGDDIGDWERYDGSEVRPEMNDGDEYDQHRQQDIDDAVGPVQFPAHAPFAVGDRVEYIGMSPQAFRHPKTGEPVCYISKGQRGTVTAIMVGFSYIGVFDKKRVIANDASMIRMDKDERGRNQYPVDIDGAHDWKIVE